MVMMESEVARQCFLEVPWSVLKMYDRGRKHWDFLGAGRG